MRKTLTMSSALAIAVAAMRPELMAGQESRTTGSKLRKPRSQHYWKPNGKRECARRRRQIASGQLTESNGLVRK